MLSKDSKLYFLLFNFESIKFQIQSYTRAWVIWKLYYDVL